MTAGAPETDLTGWRRAPFTAAGSTYDCFEKGSGPGVVVLPEIPGMTPSVLGFADHLVDNGFTVLIVSAFGTPGAPESTRTGLPVAAKACVSAEFRAFATNAKRPFSDYLRAVARDLNERTPGPGVGVIGMCFTGGFALAAAVDEVVLAPVGSQPSLPLPLGARRKADPGMSEAELSRIAARTVESGLCLMGLRFSADRLVPGERFRTLTDRLGEAFRVVELDSRPGNADGFKSNAHSVLTREVREGNAAMAARDQVVAFLHERLG
ncbi:MULTISPECIES: dienelactone hydrolase family protein [unclassified Crossiella]|uniref:dienelactone hydrolase family protein n=1 Tax=unclassified Crossiella TaxID=2620835 RepID=UPI001FFF63F7|nr:MULTISPECIES: dienelactone hydrolase family protein [unclassified Crossiella]MCK2242522.1 dienelactone hydrolase family protein [Crossiella sp. S99.2]MCK2254448.1 dienelactone hydrolase family protein [Crossiella sp. S99.1]